MSSPNLATGFFYQIGQSVTINIVKCFQDSVTRHRRSGNKAIWRDRTKRRKDKPMATIPSDAKASFCVLVRLFCIWLHYYTSQPGSGRDKEVRPFSDSGSRHMSGLKLGRIPARFVFALWSKEN